MQRPSSRGFATIATTIILSIVFAFTMVLLDTVLSGRRLQKTHEETLEAEQVAEAGVDKALFCLGSTDNAKCGGVAGINYAGETGIAFGGGTFTTSVTGTGATKTVTSTGTLPAGRTRVIVVDLTSIPPTDTMGFSYALQSGAGGARMENNSGINGTIYSNGDIICNSTNAVITGDAYSAKSGGKIEKCRVDYHAHADKVLDSSVGGDAYYNVDPTGVAGTTVSGTKHSGQSTPAVADLPAIDLQFWRDSAEAGGVIYGDYSPADASSLGPVKIVGNLTLGNNVGVTIDGPVWVVGNIATGNNSSFTLASSFGSYSTTILADDPADNTKGAIDITNNTVINGSGDSSSHILFASTCNSTSDVSPALSVANNADGAVFFAVNGTLRLQNNAGAKSLAGYRLYLDNLAVVNYVASDFTGQFSNSPGGNWRILEGTWREHQ